MARLYKAVEEWVILNDILSNNVLHSFLVEYFYLCSGKQHMQSIDSTSRAMYESTGDHHRYENCSFLRQLSVASLNFTISREFSE